MNHKFDFDLERVVQEITSKDAKLVLIQLPEGIKMYAEEIVSFLVKNTKATIIVSGESNWGGCDVALNEARNLNVDLLVHFGHAPFIKADFSILYVEVKDLTDFHVLLQQSLDSLKTFNKIGLVASIQHLHTLPDVQLFYEKHGKTVSIPSKKGFAAYDGHVVGCEYNALKTIDDKVDCFIVIGNNFHSLGAALSVQKPVFLIDVYNMDVVNMEPLKQKIVKQRAMALAKMKDARTIGIIIGTKPGQKFGTYQILKERLEKLGKNVVVLTMNEVTQEKLTNFYNIQGFIELACPRIAIEDYGKYDKPILTMKEAFVLLNANSWEDLLVNGFL
ncbi:diphthamide biosynthesis enzyme Dph2 [Candidatus Woesearchaeota archaeon]|nr:diphthamide biosynthesis enzyme Dph2 [Candidatus Woesearchaeota archaeon]